MLEMLITRMILIGKILVFKWYLYFKSFFPSSQQFRENRPEKPVKKIARTSWRYYWILFSNTDAFNQEFNDKIQGATIIRVITVATWIIRSIT